MLRQADRSENGPRVLVVEDSPTMREVARALLASAGFAVDVACDGVEAVRLADERRYALILMDINMPNLDGVEAAFMIRASEGPAQAVPILAITAERGPERIEEITKAGMNGYLAKPFGRAQLLEAVAPWVDDTARPR